jgi:hypothetical protein
MCLIYTERIDERSGETFGACPIPRGQLAVAVEPAVDSSRNFVLRIVDPATGRHAFLGMNFAERSVAFDFNVALSDFERQTVRDEEIQRLTQAEAARGGGGVEVHDTAVASLYRREDLGLKEGQTIRVNVARKSKSGVESGQAPLATPLGTLPPPPPPPSASSQRNSSTLQQGNLVPAATTVASSEAGWATF